MENSTTVPWFFNEWWHTIMDTLNPPQKSYEVVNGLALWLNCNDFGWWYWDGNLVILVPDQSLIKRIFFWFEWLPALSEYTDLLIKYSGGLAVDVSGDSHLCSVIAVKGLLSVLLNFFPPFVYHLTSTKVIRCQHKGLYVHPQHLLGHLLLKRLTIQS